MLKYLTKSAFALTWGAAALGFGMMLVGAIIMPLFLPAGVVIGAVGMGLTFVVAPTALCLFIILALFNKDQEPAKPEQQEARENTDRVSTPSSPALLRKSLSLDKTTNLDTTNNSPRQALLRSNSNTVTSSHRQSDKSRAWSLSNMWNRILHPHNNNPHHSTSNTTPRPY